MNHFLLTIYSFHLVFLSYICKQYNSERSKYRRQRHLFPASIESSGTSKNGTAQKSQWTRTRASKSKTAKRERNGPSKFLIRNIGASTMHMLELRMILKRWRSQNKKRRITFIRTTSKLASPKKWIFAHW